MFLTDVQKRSINEESVRRYWQDRNDLEERTALNIYFSYSAQHLGRRVIRNRGEGSEWSISVHSAESDCIPQARDPSLDGRSVCKGDTGPQNTLR